jgi:hypothetical protein
MIKSRLLTLLSKAILLLGIQTQTQIIVHGFSIGDTSSIAAAVAAAHIGKPPPFHASLRSTTTTAKDLTTNGCHNGSNHSCRCKNDMIGKPPTRPHNNIIVDNTPQTTIFEQIHRYSATFKPFMEVSIQTSTDASRSDGASSSVMCNVLEIDPNDFETTIRIKRNELEIFISEHETIEKIIEDNNIDNVIDLMPTVPAVFCGYKATPEELLRLRSAHVVV